MEHAGMTDDTLMTAEPVRTAALRRWIGDNATRIDLRKVSRDWFIDLMMGKAA
jgi:hypothetical protein